MYNQCSVEFLLMETISLSVQFNLLCCLYFVSFFFFFPFLYVLYIIDNSRTWCWMDILKESTYSSRSISPIIAVYRIKIITQLLLIALVMYGYLIKFVSKWNGKKLFTKIKLSCFWNGNKFVTSFSTFFSWNEDKHSDFRFQ